MDISLEKIDMIVERTGVSYAKAKESLEKTNGDLVEAIILLEESHNMQFDNPTETGKIIINKVKEILRKGNVTKITVSKDGETILNIPVSAAAIGGLISVPLALVGLGGALISQSSIEILKEDGEVINVNQLIKKNIGGK